MGKRKLHRFLNLLDLCIQTYKEITKRSTYSDNN
jgi:hypothetical protein